MRYLDSLKVTIPCHPEAKGNSRTFGRTWTGKPILRKSDKARSFMELAKWTIRNAAGPNAMFDPQAALVLTCAVAYPDRRHDLDVSLVMDALEKSGVVQNDVQFTRVVAMRFDELGSEVEIEIKTNGNLPWTRRVTFAMDAEKGGGE